MVMARTYKRDKNGKFASGSGGGSGGGLRARAASATSQSRADRKVKGAERRLAAANQKPAGGRSLIDINAHVASRKNRLNTAREIAANGGRATAKQAATQASIRAFSAKKYKKK